MKAVYRLFLNRKGVFLLTLFCCIGSVTITLLWNSQLAKGINDIQAGNGFGVERLGECAILVILGAILQGGIYFFAAYTGEYAAHDLRMRLAQVTLKKPYSLIAKESSGEQISSQQNETEEINQYISDSLFSLCSMVINFLFTLLFLLRQNVKLTLTYTAPVLFLTLYTMVSSKVIYGYTVQEQEQTKKMNGMTGTLLMLFPVIRIYEAEKLLQNHFYRSISDWQQASVAEERVKARLMSLSGILSCLPLALLLLAGGTMVVKGTFSLGMLYVFVNLSGNVSGVMMNLPSHLASFRRFCGNLDRIWSSVDWEGEEKNEYSFKRS